MTNLGMADVDSTVVRARVVFSLRLIVMMIVLCASYVVHSLTGWVNIMFSCTYTPSVVGQCRGNEKARGVPARCLLLF